MGTLDIVVIVATILFLIIGIIVGFFGKIGKLVSFVCAIVVSYFIANPINGALKSNGVYDPIINNFGGNEKIVGLMMLGIVFFVCFLIIFIILILVFKAFKSVIDKFKFLKIIDHILGGVLGAANGLFLCCIAFLIMGVIAQTNSGLNEWVTNDLASQSQIAQRLFDFANWSVAQIQDVIQ